MRALGKGTTRKNQLHYSQKGDLHDNRKIVSKAVGSWKKNACLFSGVLG